ncbi:MAG TPA: pseudouridine-5-phosphate glycosidase, partial [Anaerolineae bacterium]|nr:pseudouridine-5-phosphate glycosidase [Anaerolineae bacterium]
MIMQFMKIHPEVETALAEGKALVALESTVITHGLPYPDNVATALAMEARIREQGAVPATIAIIDGIIRVGMDKADLEHLAGLPTETVRKCSRRDLPLVLAQKGHGATTVAGTMIIARQVGIELFATGGMGGV